MTTLESEQTYEQKYALIFPEEYGRIIEELKRDKAMTEADEAQKLASGEADNPDDEQGG